MSETSSPEDTPNTDVAEKVIDANTDVVETNAPVEALAHGLTMQAQLYAASNQNEKQAENPDDFVFNGPFDSKKAIDEIFHLNRAVSESEREWKRAKEFAAKRKESYDEAVTAFTTRVRELEDWERGIEQQPRLKTLTDVERAKETADERRKRLSESLPAKNFYITEDELASVDRVDLDTLDNWLQMSDGVVPPELLSKAHIAGPVGPEHGAHCRRCCAALGMVTDGETTADYPEDAFVGLECDGIMREEARPIAKRGSKRGRKKVDHDAERQAQTQDGQRARATQKSSARCACGEIKTITPTEDPREFATSCPNCGAGVISWASAEDVPDFLTE